VAFAASAVALGLGAHATAGGELPPLPLLVPLVVLVEAMSSTFARRPRGPLATAAALLASQLGLHAAFAFAAPTHAVHVGHVPTLEMLLAHGVAALVLAATLSRGEELISHAAGLLLPVAVLVPFRPGPPSFRLPVAAPGHRVPLRLGASLHDISRRGPPRRRSAART
jgi:hypothetical protein